MAPQGEPIRSLDLGGQALQRSGEDGVEDAGQGLFADAAQTAGHRSDAAVGLLDPVKPLVLLGDVEFEPKRAGERLGQLAAAPAQDAKP